MDNEFKILDQNVFIPDDYLQKIRYILKDRFNIKSDFEKDLNGNIIDLKCFYWCIEEIIEVNKNEGQNYLRDRTFLGCDPKLIDELLLVYEKYMALKDKVYNLDDVKMTIDLTVSIVEKTKYMYLTRELSLYKNDIMKDMTYYKSQDEIDLFFKEYDEAVKIMDVEKMESMILSFQKEISDEWKKFLSFQKQDSIDDFLFIGHATSNIESWEKNTNGKEGKIDTKSLFMSRYISCSLISPDTTGTYQNRTYGFIMKPENIVGARSEDMGVYNYADNKSEVDAYSVYPKMNHPLRVLEESKVNQRHDNIDAFENLLHSEVLIDGFEPIGIFCFTLGIDKDPSLIKAKRLQNCFPNLEIKSIDLFKIKKGEDLRNVEVELINKILSDFGRVPSSNKVTVHDLPRYRRFLNDFYTMKSNGVVSYEDVKDSLKKNQSLLFGLETNENMLFDGRFNHEDIKFILGNNPNYNIDYILSGDIKVHTLSNLRNLYPVRSKLDKYYPGLGVFVELINRFDITNEDIESFVNSNNYSFDNFSKIFMVNVEARLKGKKDETEALVEADMASYNALIDEKNELQVKQQKYDDSFFILSNAPWKLIILNDIKDLELEIEETQVKYNRLDNQKRILENQLSQLMNDHNVEKNKKFIKTDDIIKLEEKVASLDKEIESMSSTLFRRVINKGKIKAKKDEASLVNEDISRNIQNFELNQQHLLSVSEFRIELVTRQLNETEEKMRECDYTIRHNKDRVKVATKTLLEYFKVDSLDKIDDAISEAKRYINEEYDSSTQSRLAHIEMQINELAQRIAFNNNEIIALDQEIKGISL